jgi:hypothetical protein
MHSRRHTCIHICIHTGRWQRNWGQFRSICCMYAHIHKFIQIRTYIYAYMQVGENQIGDMSGLFVVCKRTFEREELMHPMVIHELLHAWVYMHACMHVCMYVAHIVIYIYMYVYVYVCKRTFEREEKVIHELLHAWVYMYVCMYVCMYVYTHVCTCIHSHIRIHVHICVCM